MADDMNNGNEPTRTYAPTDSIAALSERITNLNRRQTDSEAETRTAFRSMENIIDKLASEMRSGLANLSTNLAERNKPQWQALGVALTFAAILGGMAYWPIRESTNDLKASDVETARIIQSLASETNKSIQALASSTVSRQEMDWRAQRGAEDRVRMEAAIADLRGGTVTRSEWMERSRAIDQQGAEFSRRLDELRQDFGAVYGTRDVIQDMKREIDELRRKVPPS